VLSFVLRQVSADHLCKYFMVGPSTTACQATTTFSVAVACTVSVCSWWSPTRLSSVTGGDTAAASASAAAAAALGSAPAADKKPARSRKPSAAKAPAPVLLPPVADDPFELPSAAIKAKEAAVDSEVEKERVRFTKESCGWHTSMKTLKADKSSRACLPNDL
jgi:hypothetical protein